MNDTDTAPIDAEWDAWHFELLKDLAADDIPQRARIEAHEARLMCRRLSQPSLLKFVDDTTEIADKAEAEGDWDEFLASGLCAIVGRAELFRRAGLSVKLLPVGVL
jgi:hypothetical protein